LCSDSPAPSKATRRATSPRRAKRTPDTPSTATRARASPGKSARVRRDSIDTEVTDIDFTAEPEVHKDKVTQPEGDVKETAVSSAKRPPTSPKARFAMLCFGVAGLVLSVQLNGAERAPATLAAGAASVAAEDKTMTNPNVDMANNAELWQTIEAVAELSPVIKAQSDIKLTGAVPERETDEVTIDLATAESRPGDLSLDIALTETIEAMAEPQKRKGWGLLRRAGQFFVGAASKLGPSGTPSESEMFELYNVVP